MRFGLFSLFSQPNMGVPQADVYRNGFDLCERADRAGFDCLWVAEHHFSNFGLASAPLALALEIAHRTERARVGVAVLVLPFYAPVRLAEEVAMVDVLTGGRLNVGIGRGYQAYEFERFGVPMDQARERFEEVHDVLIKAWQETAFTYQGEHVTIPPTTVFPRPVQQPHPPLWVAGASAETIDFAARHGYNLFTVAGMGPLSAVERGRDLFWEALARHGRRPGSAVLGAQRTILVTRDQREADAAIDDALYQYRLSRRYRTNTVEVVDGFARPTPFPDEPTHEEARGQLIWGSPEECVEQIERHREVGVSYLNLMFNVGGLTHEQSLRSFDLFVERVMPHFVQVEQREPAAVG